MVNPWPLQADCDRYYGNPRGRNGQVSITWKAMNLTTVRPPFVMRYAGKPVKAITIHKKCAASLSRVLQAIWVASGKSQAQIDRWGVSIFGGSFNYRLMRGSSHLSMHSYGCAIDLAPNWFPMGHHDHTFVSQVIKAFADEGWENLPNDRMHFQAARVAGLPAPQAAPVKPAAPIPASKPQSFGDMKMAVLSTNTLNVGSASVLWSSLATLLPIVVKEGSTVGWVAAGALTVAALIQTFLPAGTAKAVENAVVAGAIPVAEALAPQYKPQLEEVKAGVVAAQGLPATN